MNEKALPVLEQYDLKIKGTKRVRGSYYCDTDKGLMLLKEYENSRGRLEMLEKLQLHLESCEMKTDRVIRNAEGELMSLGPDGGYYIVKKWFEHRESEPDNVKDILKGVRSMAALHKNTKDLKNVFTDQDNILRAANLKETLDRHNREMLKVKRYISKMKNKTGFEMRLVKEIDIFYKQAEEAVSFLDGDVYEKYYGRAKSEMTMCHGNFQYHNVIMVRETPVIVNYIRAANNLQIADVYTFLKKCMEKNQWDVELAKRIMHEYESINPLNNDEKNILRVMLLYPEKFWKIVNNYYNSNKAWVSEKNREKLKQFEEQEKNREEFLELW